MRNLPDGVSVCTPGARPDAAPAGTPGSPLGAALVRTAHEVLDAAPAQI